MYTYKGEEILWSIQLVDGIVCLDEVCATFREQIDWLLSVSVGKIRLRRGMIS